MSVGALLDCLQSGLDQSDSACEVLLLDERGGVGVAAATTGSGGEEDGGAEDRLESCGESHGAAEGGGSLL